MRTFVSVRSRRNSILFEVNSLLWYFSYQKKKLVFEEIALKFIKDQLLKCFLQNKLFY